MTEQEKQVKICQCQNSITVLETELTKLQAIPIEPSKPDIKIVNHLAMFNTGYGLIKINSDYNYELKLWQGNTSCMRDKGTWSYLFNECREIAHILLKMTGDE